MTADRTVCASPWQLEPRSSGLRPSQFDDLPNCPEFQKHTTPAVPTTGAAACAARIDAVEVIGVVAPEDDRSAAPAGRAMPARASTAPTARINARVAAGRENGFPCRLTAPVGSDRPALSRTFV